jgi:predicted transposase YbfD/YdcC
VLDQPATAERVRRGLVAGLLEALTRVPDPRGRRGVRFSLPVVLGLALLATVCGARTFVELAEVASDLDPDLSEPFGLVRTPPSAATFRRVLCAVDPGVLDEALTRWALDLPLADDEPEAEPEAGLVEVAEPARVRVRGRVSLDGKSLKGGRVTDETGKKTQYAVLEAVDHTSKAVLGQEQIIAGDEIAAARAMVARLAARPDALTGLVVVADAKHTQHDLVALINDSGGYWILPAKHNQPTIAAYVEALPWADVPALDLTRGKEHGRQETRTLRVVELPATAPKLLAGAVGAIKVFRHVLRKKTPTATPRWTRESAYLLTSLPAQAASAADLAQMIRGHWLVESLHWTRDTLWDEDKHTARSGHGPVNLACLRNTAVTRLHQTGHHDLQPTTRACNRKPERAFAIITGASDQL